MEQLNKNAINKGLILAFVSIMMQLLIFYVAPQLSGSMGLGAGMGLIALLLYIFFTIDLRKQVGGFWSFKEALQGIFLMAIVAGVLSSVFVALYFKFVEPQAFEKVEPYVTASMRANMEMFGADESKIDDAVAQQMEGIKSTYSPTFGQFAKTFGFSIIFQFIMSLIFAAIFKKNAPVFLDNEE